MDSYVSSKERLLSEIERNRSGVIIMHLNRYGRIDGIETSRQIRSRFGVPVCWRYHGLQRLIIFLFYVLSCSFFSTFNPKGQTAEQIPQVCPL
jgi:hypothetical protein